jgi:hypothetical protein
MMPPMTGRARSVVRSAALFAAGALCATLVALAVAAGLDTSNIRVTSRDSGTRILGVRPTGVGLPLVGASGTVGAGDYDSALKSYHDSGDYEKDLGAVDGRAGSYLDRKVRGLRHRTARRCARAKRNGLQGAALQRACAKPKLAMVLDIDETSLSNYSCLSSADFKQATAALAQCLVAGTSPAIAPTKTLFDRARAKGVAVFFITGRPDSIPGVRQQTETNLKSAGYDGWKGLVLNPSLGGPTIPYKSGARAEIEKQGYRIVLNVGDQESDLAGGHADRGFKLPNPFYFIG